MSADKVVTDAELKQRIQIKLPALPNFLLTTDGRSIDVGTIPDATLRVVGEKWTEKLIAHARGRKTLFDK